MSSMEGKNTGLGFSTKKYYVKPEPKEGEILTSKKEIRYEYVSHELPENVLLVKYLKKKQTKEELAELLTYFPKIQLL